MRQMFAKCVMNSNLIPGNAGVPIMLHNNLLSYIIQHGRFTFKLQPYIKCSSMNREVSSQAVKDEKDSHSETSSNSLCP